MWRSSLSWARIEAEAKGMFVLSGLQLPSAFENVKIIESVIRPRPGASTRNRL